VTAAVLLMAVLAVDGLVVNKTTGAPVAGVNVTLIQAGQGGMRPLGNAASGADGRFAIAQSTSGETVGLLQAVYQGVTYNRMLQPGAWCISIELAVF